MREDRLGYLKTNVSHASSPCRATSSIAPLRLEAMWSVSWLAPSQLASQPCESADAARSEKNTIVSSSRASREHSQSSSNGSPNPASSCALAKANTRHGDRTTDGLVGDGAATPRAFLFRCFEPLGRPTPLHLAIPAYFDRSECANTAATSASVHSGLVILIQDLQFHTSRIDSSVTPCTAASRWLAS
eukprot:1763523-Rhodomonas_salina.1